MDQVSGHGRANVQSDDETTGGAGRAAVSSNPFGLETYTGRTTRTNESVEPTQPEQTEPEPAKPARPDRQVEARWRTRIGEPVVGGPVAHDDRLIVTGRSGRIYALDATDGTERWRSRNRVATTTPAADSELAFVGNEDGLQAFDTADGTVRWTFEIDGTIEATPVAQNGIVHVTTESGQVYLLDAERGSRRAAFGHGCQAISSLAVGRETILLGNAGGGLQARCITDGRERWRCAQNQAVVAAPVVADDHVYVPTIDGDNILEIDRVTGAAHQRFQVDSPVWGRPVVTDDTLVAVGQDGNVSAFDRTAGTRRWQVELNGSVWCGPTVHDRRVYTVDDAGWTYALDTSAGERCWQFDTGAAITTAPTIADGAVVVATEAGSVYALGETGI